MVQLQGQLAGAMSALVTVRALGREQLARAFSTHSTLVSQQRGQARLAGTPFQVEAALGRDAPILIGVFKLDAGVTGQVVWAADAPGSPWIPVASKLSRDHAGRTATDMTRGPGMITFGIQASGIYALATRPVVRAGRETEDQDRRAGEREDDR